MNISEDEFLEKCLELLDHFDVDYKGDFVEISDGGNSCIANPNSQFAKLFGGYSINSIAKYVAKKLNKKTKWVE